MQTRTCTKCSRDLPATLEYFHKKGAGLCACCKDCKKATDHNYRQDNAGRLQEYEKQRSIERKDAKSIYYKLWSQEHRDAIVSAGHLYRTANKEQRRIKHQHYYQANKEKHKEWSKTWRSKNPEQFRLSMVSRASRRRARIKGAGGSHTIQDVERQYAAQHGKCYWCKGSVTKYHVDHVIPISRGGSDEPSNIVIACPHCNESKSNKLPHEWPDGGHLL